MKLQLILTLLVSAALAGCTTSDSGTQSSTETPPMTYTAPDLNGTWPSGQDARDYIASYIMTHPFRVGGQFQDYMDTARDDLVTILEGFDGLNVTRHDYSGGQNILAFQYGTMSNMTVEGYNGTEKVPDPTIVLSAHYDSVGVGGLGPTVYGAWDDGAGVAVLIELAETLSTYEFPFTIVYAFFDGEEKGLVGSGQFVNTFYQNGEMDIVANLNTDPPGLNYPCGDPSGDFPVKIIHEMGKVGTIEGDNLTRYQYLYQAVESGLENATVPAYVRDYTPGIPIAQVAGTGLSGTSDHARFGQVDIANVFLGGVPTTTVGPVSALTYALHTPLDTLQHMEARCVTGSLSGGLQTILDVFTHSLLWMADNEIPVA